MRPAPAGRFLFAASSVAYCAACFLRIPLMNEQLPFAEACERNRQPILDVLQQEFPARGKVLEIGSATGQHVVYFAPRMSGLCWQPSDCSEYLPGLAARLQLEGSDNIQTAIELDVLQTWPDRQFDAVFSSNTAHIMSWPAVCAMFRGVARVMKTGGVFCLYGPFNEDGAYTSESNGIFDRQLKSRNPEMGIRNRQALNELARDEGLQAAGRHAMPANNQVLVFRKAVES